MYSLFSFYLLIDPVFIVWVKYMFPYWSKTEDKKFQYMEIILKISNGQQFEHFLIDNHFIGGHED